MKQWQLAFVVPRYGPDILGGAETLVRLLAEHVVAGGYGRVEVFTTCARDHLSWENERPAGSQTINGVRVHFFPVAFVDQTRFERLQHELLQYKRLPSAEQYEWVNTGPHSPALYAHLEQEGERFDFILFVPYLFSTTYYGTAIYPERSVLWPCLHDEIFAYLEPTYDMYRSCVGIMLNTYPEQRLAHRLYGVHPGERVVGFGMEPFTANSERFRAHYRLGDTPLLLYSGRLEMAKNVHVLVDYFVTYKSKRSTPLKLVLMGQGPYQPPVHPDILPIGFKQGSEKLDAYAAATVLCQPSVMESFSIVIMEAWLASTPVLVHADCEVTRYHVLRSNGGLYFRSYNEFEAVLDLLLASPELRNQLAQNGYRYVQTHYSWEHVLKRFRAALEHWEKLKRGEGIKP